MRLRLAAMKRLSFMALLSLMSAPLLPAEAEPTISVRIYDRSGLPRSDVDRSLRELKAIYRSAGIDVAVRDCPLPDSCPEDFGANEVGVRLLAGTSPAGPHQLAAAFVARGGNLCTLYGGAVAEAAARSGVAISRVLGYTMAHEAAHLFGLAHTGAGVMSAGWTDTDYRAMGDGRIMFTRAEAGAIRTQITKKASMASLR
jgi:hypothetical protein